MDEFYIKEGDPGHWLHVYKVSLASVNGRPIYEWTCVATVYISPNMVKLSKEEVKVQMSLGLIPSWLWHNGLRYDILPYNVEIWV